jgi:hypothetical protein
VQEDEELSCDAIQVTLENTAATPAKGPIVLTDTVPDGLQVGDIEPGGKAALRVGFYWARDPRDSFLAGKEGEKSPGIPLDSGELCTLVGDTVACTLPAEVEGSVGELKTDWCLEMDIYVLVERGAIDAPNTVRVTENGCRSCQAAPTMRSAPKHRRLVPARSWLQLPSATAPRIAALAATRMSSPCD